MDNNCMIFIRVFDCYIHEPFMYLKLCIFHCRIASYLAQNYDDQFVKKCWRYQDEIDGSSLTFLCKWVQPVFEI